MVFCVIITFMTILLLRKVDFVTLTPEEIERVEIEELKHRMQLKEHQTKQRKTLAEGAIGQDDFVPVAKQAEGGAQMIRAKTQGAESIALPGMIPPMMGPGGAPGSMSPAGGIPPGMMPPQIGGGMM